LAGYYVFGLPIGALVAFYFEFGLLGLWIGLTIGIVFVSVMELGLVRWWIDWEEEAKRALRLVGEEEVPLLDDQVSFEGNV
jgi:MATE family multidrug resistance protein